MRWIPNQFERKQSKEDMSKKAKRGQRALRSKQRLEREWKALEKEWAGYELVKS